MTAVKVVLSNGEGDELELGTFNQGVLVDGLVIRDVASREAVAFIGDLTSKWHRVLPQTRGYDDAFIHAAPAPVEAVDEPAGGCEKVIDGVPMRRDVNCHSWVAQGETRVDPDGNGAVKVGEESLGDRGVYVSICDILGSHRRSVPLEEWESWER